MKTRIPRGKRILGIHEEVYFEEHTRKPLVRVRIARSDRSETVSDISIGLSARLVPSLARKYRLRTVFRGFYAACR